MYFCKHTCLWIIFENGCFSRASVTFLFHHYQWGVFFWGGQLYDSIILPNFQYNIMYAQQRPSWLGLIHDRIRLRGHFPRVVRQDTVCCLFRFDKLNISSYWSAGWEALGLVVRVYSGRWSYNICYIYRRGSMPSILLKNGILFALLSTWLCSNTYQ